MSKEITPAREIQSGLSAAPDFGALMAQALAAGPEAVGGMEQIVALYERMEDRRKDAERKAAIAAAKAKFTPVGRGHATNHTKVSRDGAILSGGYARIEDIQKMVDPIFSDLGLDYRWGYDVVDGKSWLVFYVTHANGTEEERSRTEYAPDTSGSKSASQARSSGETYAMRGTMRMGLSVRFSDDCSEDDDAREAPEAKTVTADEAMALEARCAEAGADLGRFFKAFGIEQFRQMPAESYPKAMADLNRKIKREQAQA